VGVEKCEALDRGAGAAGVNAFGNQGLVACREGEGETTTRVVVLLRGLEEGKGQEARVAAPSLACLFIDGVGCGCKFALWIAGVVVVGNGEFVGFSSCVGMVRPVHLMRVGGGAMMRIVLVCLGIHPAFPSIDDTLMLVFVVLGRQRDIHTCLVCLGVCPKGTQSSCPSSYPPPHYLDPARIVSACRFRCRRVQDGGQKGAHLCVVLAGESTRLVPPWCVCLASSQTRDERGVSFGGECGRSSLLQTWRISLDSLGQRTARYIYNWPADCVETV